MTPRHPPHALTELDHADSSRATEVGRLDSNPASHRTNHVVSSGPRSTSRRFLPSLSQRDGRNDESTTGSVLTTNPFLTRVWRLRENIDVHVKQFACVTPPDCQGAGADEPQLTDRSPPVEFDLSSGRWPGGEAVLDRHTPRPAKEECYHNRDHAVKRNCRRALSIRLIAHHQAGQGVVSRTLVGSRRKVQRACSVTKRSMFSSGEGRASLRSDRGIKESLERR